MVKDGAVRLPKGKYQGKENKGDLTIKGTYVIDSKGKVGLKPGTRKILDNKGKFDQSLSVVLTDLIEAVGFYPYISKENLQLDSTDSLIRQVYHHSGNLNKYLHEDQKHLLSLLNSDKNVIVSAPTSFGKSLLIEEIIASNKFKNIIIIQPTLALLDETRRKLKKYDENYKLIVRTSQESSKEKGNIYLFTAERVNEYKEFPHIDFIIIDECHRSIYNLWKQVLDYFDAFLIGLTATPDKRTFGFFEKNVVSEYTYEQSVIDGVNVPYDVYNIETKISQKGDVVKKG